MTARLGPALAEPVVARGAAYADYDLDGDLDLLVTTNNGRARLLRNDGGNGRHFLRVSTVGSSSNRDGIGAKVVALIDGRPGPWALVKTGSSYASQSELPVTLGLGNASRVSGLRITWPNGQVEELPALDADQAITVKEGQGIVPEP
jgi:hypothetical protein